MEDGQDIEYMHLGLRVLASMALSERNALNLIDRLIENENHVLHEYLLNTRIKISLINNDLSKAELVSKSLIFKYPDSKLKKEAYWTLAFYAYNKKPVNYRLVADYLIKIKDLTINISDKLIITLNVADCYFLSDDIDNAIHFYTQVYRDTNPQLARNAYLQIINSYLKNKQITSAINFVKRESINHSTPNLHFESYWNIIIHLMQNNLFNDANTIIISVLEKKDINSHYKYKYLWLKSKISFREKKYMQCIQQLDSLMLAIHETNSTVVHNNHNLLALIMLDKAHAHLQNSEPALAFTLFDRMKELEFNDSLIEKCDLIKANYYGANNQLDKALKILISISDNFTDHKNALIALNEASIYLERLGQNQHLIQCVGILKRIINDFPLNNAIFHAKIRLINIYRKLDEFNLALDLSSEILTSEQYHNHKQLHVIYLIQSDCMHAIAQNNKIKLQEVYDNYDEIRRKYNSNHQLNTEVIYKQSIILRKLGQYEKLKKLLYKEIIHNYLNNIVHHKLNANSLHWISRSLLHFSNIYNINGEVDKAQNIYRKMIQHQLPGYKIAQQQLDLIK